jgi:hypothetical protein
VFNDAGANVDFRVEGDTDANLLFVDASADAVGIGTSSPATLLHLKSTTSGAPQLRIEGAGADNGVITFLGDGHTNPAVGIRYISTGDSTGNLAFYANGISSGTLTERMLIDSAGNVGIGTSGTSSPVSPLTVNKGNVTSAGQWASSAISVANPTNTGSYSQIAFGYTVGTTNAAAYMGFISTNQSANGFGDLVFGTRSVSTDTQPSERMRIDSSGNLLAGTTTPLTTSAHSFQALGTTTGDYAAAFQQNATGASGRLLRWLLPNTNDAASYFVFATNSDGNCLNIFGNGNITNTNNSYGGISDIKLKENIVDTSPKLDKIAQVRVVSYNLKSNPEQKLLGVVAQELEQIFPSMVSETQDYITVTKTREVEAVFDDEGNEITPATTEEYTEQEATGTTTKSVKYSVFVPMLIKAIQELSAKNDALEARIAALENA